MKERRESGILSLLGRRAMVFKIVELNYILSLIADQNPSSIVHRESNISG
jgi:hypothetical protein